MKPHVLGLFCFHDIHSWGHIIMDRKSNFRPRIIEPANSFAPNGIGVGVELEFCEDIPGIRGDTLLLFLRDDADMDQAENLRNLLSDLVLAVKVSNPK